MKKRFVLLASMRTGSNLLNSNLNQYAGLICQGEAFNPAFVGLSEEYQKLFGFGRGDVAKRDSDPLGFLEAILAPEAEAIGLHMFPGHNREVLDLLLADRQVAKICLRRSLIHSFVSLQIARKTDVWRVTQQGPARQLTLADKQIVFKPQEFEAYRRSVDRFWTDALAVLGETKQEYFPIWYREISDVAKLNAIAEFLGVAERKNSLSAKLARQNPEPLKEIVQNWDEMVAYARSVRLDHQI